MNSLRHRLRFKSNGGVACEKGLFINCAQVWKRHGLWLTIAFLCLTSRLLDSLMKHLRAGRSVRLWLNPDANTQGYKMPISQTIASFLMRRRSLQLLSRLQRFRSFPGFSVVVDLQCQPVACCSRHIIQKFWNFNDCSPTQREASWSAMTVRRQQISSRACRSANCVPKAAIDYLVQEKVPETFVSEIVRPSLEAAKLLSVSAPLAAAATRVRVDPSGDVVMTPTDQAQQDEDANLRKIVAQLHVNFGHQAMMLWPGPSDCLEDLTTQSRPHSRFGALFVSV